MITNKTIASYLQVLEPIPTGIEPSGQLKQKVTCVLFDVYGTLFISGSGDIGTSLKTDTNPDLVVALLKKYNVVDRFDTLREKLVAAIKAEHKRKRAQRIDSPEVRLEKIWAQVLGWREKNRVWDFAMEYETLVNPVYPMPHLAEVLTELKCAGLTLGLVSNAQFYTPFLFEWFLKRTLPQLGFTAELTVMSFQYGAAKPSLALFNQVLKPLSACGISPPEVLYLGNDMLNDILPATQLGFQTALFAGDKRSLRLRSGDPRCSHLRPDLTLTDLSQLLTHLSLRPS